MYSDPYDYYDAIEAESEMMHRQAREVAPDHCKDCEYLHAGDWNGCTSGIRYLRGHKDIFAACELMYFDECPEDEDYCPIRSAQ